MTAARRGPGRPPDLAKRQAILDAAREVLAEVGYGAMTIDAVAQRAGSNRLLIYRVWDSKVSLAADALFGEGVDLTVPDTGSTEGDLRDFIAQVVANIRRPAYVKGAPGLTVELLNDPALFRATYERYIRPSDDGFAVILDRAAARGERVDVDARLVTRIVSGTTTGLAQATSMTVAEITDLLVRMLLGGLVHD